jgi:xylulokinase
MYLLGYDSGTSSIKATLLNAQTGQVEASCSWPPTEMPIQSPQPGFAEQDPQLWWDNLKGATARVLAESGVNPADIKAIGISYQMHGLVCVDKTMAVIRPSIIWCDSRAVKIGQKAAQKIGGKKCLKNLLNLPGNFTAGKLRWVKENEPANFKRVYKIMLPGDWLAMKMTGVAATTASGLSEMILWDFVKRKPADFLMKHYGFDESFLPDIVPTFGMQGQLTSSAANELGLAAGTPVTYRAGDQPNNALSLNVLNPGEIAATAGTSGVVYGISSKAAYDPKSRVNTFLHVNDTAKTCRNGVLLCVNGTGRLNSWLKHNVMAGKDYPEMNALAEKVAVGSDGLVILPYGNGAERTLENKNIGTSIQNLDLNMHHLGHILRASQEGIVFAINYGLEIMKDMGLQIKTVRAGKANMFLSDIFATTFATLTGATVELYNTDGSQGAARGAGLGAEIYKSAPEAFATLKKLQTIEPDAKMKPACKKAYGNWLKALEKTGI